MRRAALVGGLLLYAAGGALALALIAVVARTDTAIVRLEAPAAPALELAAGVYEIRTGSPATPGAARPEAAVFALGTREPLPLRASGAGSAFEVRERGVYVVELPSGAGTSSVHERQRLVVSPTLLFVLAIAPVATLPGAFLLEAAVRERTAEVMLAGSRFRVASVRRRLAAVVLDLVAIAVMLVLLLLAAPLFAPVAPLFPLAPVAYLWAGNARGRTVGRWLAGTRVVNAAGRAPGALPGLLRTGGWVASWGLLGAGYVAAALRASRRAPHDALAGTYVVYD